MFCLSMVLKIVQLWKICGCSFQIAILFRLSKCNWHPLLITSKFSFIWLLRMEFNWTFPVKAQIAVPGCFPERKRSKCLSFYDKMWYRFFSFNLDASNSAESFKSFRSLTFSSCWLMDHPHNHFSLWIPSFYYQKTHLQKIIAQICTRKFNKLLSQKRHKFTRGSSITYWAR